MKFYVRFIQYLPFWLAAYRMNGWSILLINTGSEWAHISVMLLLPWHAIKLCRYVFDPSEIWIFWQWTCFLWKLIVTNNCSDTLKYLWLFLLEKKKVHKTTENDRFCLEGKLLKSLCMKTIQNNSVVSVKLILKQEKKWK